MFWPNKYSRFGLGVIGLVALSGCTKVNYVNHADYRGIGRQGDDPSAFSRQVDFHVARAFYETPLPCAMVLPISPDRKINKTTAVLVEDAVSRYATGHFDRVISARQTRNVARKRAFDPAHAGDQIRLGRSMDCPAHLEIGSLGVANLYAVIWTNISVNVQLRLRRNHDHKILWQARHQAERADGGLPMGILGIGVGTLSAAKLASDRDTLPSMIDDAVRRMMISLPDLRRFTS